MGLFKGLQEIKENTKRLDEIKEKGLHKNVLVTTAFTLDEPFETIGLITTTVQCAATDFSKVVDSLQLKAAYLGADAIIGFHAMQAINPLKWLDQTAYGTAVRYKK